MVWKCRTEAEEARDEPKRQRLAQRAEGVAASISHPLWPLRPSSPTSPGRGKETIVRVKPGSETGFRSVRADRPFGHAAGGTSAPLGPPLEVPAIQEQGLGQAEEAPSRRSG